VRRLREKVEADPTVPRRIATVWGVGYRYDRKEFDELRHVGPVALWCTLPVALLGLIALAATSTDGMVRRMGRRWQSLHRLIYAIALLALIHYWMQSKLDIWEPTIVVGIYIWLMGYRLLLHTVGVRGRLPSGFPEADGARVGFRHRAPDLGEHNDDLARPPGARPAPPASSSIVASASSR